MTFQGSAGGAFPSPSYSWDFGDGTASSGASTSHVYGKAGNYTVTLTEKNSSGSSSASNSVPVSPGAPLTAGFSFSPTNPTAKHAVTFTNQSTGSPEPSYFWSFGDGSNSTDKNPTHTYTAAGTYNVKLTATNPTGSKVATQALSVSPSPPIAAFDFTPPAPVVGQLVSFQDLSAESPTSWSWNFGDGSGAAGPNVAHAYSAARLYFVTLTAKNAYGSNSVTQALTVVPAIPAADFSFTPTAPVAGQAITFTDLSTGGPTAWAWSFGDGTTSAAQNPTHTYSTPGSYNVKLKATNVKGSSSVTKPLTVSPATRSATLSVAGHVAGAGGVLFVTDVEIENPNTVVVAADLFFFPVGSTTSSKVSLTLLPLETLSLPDVVATQFGATNLFGSLRLDTQGSPPPVLHLTSRTYDQVGNMRCGTSIPGFVGSTSSPAPRFVTGLRQNNEYRSALGAVNASSDVESFQVLVHGSDGSVLGTSPAVSLEPSEQWQMSLVTLFPSVSGAGLTAEFQPLPGSNSPYAYGTLAGNLSGDLSYFPSMLSSATLYLPLISKVTGRGGALYQGEVTLSNLSDSSNSVTFTFFEHDRDNTNGAKTAQVALSPNETRLIPDLLDLFGVSETYGAVRIDSTSPIVVTERITTAAATGSGVVGQEVDPIPPDGFFLRASILGLRQDDTSRSNVSFFNPNSNFATVNLTLRRPSGEVLSTAAVPLPPLGFMEFSLGALFPGVAFPPGEPLTLTLDAGSSAIAVVGSVADSVSRDLTAAPALP